MYIRKAREGRKIHAHGDKSTVNMSREESPARDVPLCLRARHNLVVVRWTGGREDGRTPKQRPEISTVCHSVIPFDLRDADSPLCDRSEARTDTSHD